MDGTWNVQGNQVSGILNINQSADASIGGTIFGDCIEGIYVPATRRLVFALKEGDCSANGFQIYEAWVDREAGGIYMGGEFHVWRLQDFGSPTSGADFNFHGTKQIPLPTAN